MLLNTRRRMLGLLAASLGASRLLPFCSPALAAKGECFALKSFGQWKGVATNTQAGARISQIEFSNPDGCDLRGEIQVATSYDTALVVYGSPDTTRLPKDFLVETSNRLIVRDDAGKVVIDVPLCGVCNEIRDDKVTIILPLATAPLFREKPSVEIAVKLGDKEECRFSVNCEDLRAALEWAAKRKEGLATRLRRQEMHAAGRRLLSHHGLLRGARPPRRLLRARDVAPLSRPCTRRLAARPGGRRALLSSRAGDPGGAA